MPKRRGVWEDTLLNEAVLSAATNVVTLIGGYSNEQTHGMTLVRTLIGLSLFDTAGEVVEGVMRVTLGIGLASQEAFSTPNATADPAVQGDRPLDGWIFRRSVVTIGSLASATQVTLVNADIRAGRKIDGGELFITMKNELVTGTPHTVRVSGYIRMLLLRP